MSVHPPLRRAVALALTSLLVAGCAGSAARPVAGPAPRAAADPAGARTAVTEAIDVSAGPHEVTVTADFGALPDGSGNAVVETSWTVDAAGTTHVVVDTPAGVAEQHVMTEHEHWWWIHPSAREAIVDAEWVHFDLRAIDEVGGALPDLVAEARAAVPHPGELAVGHSIAGHEVLAVEVVDDDEVRLRMDGIERPVRHRRRPLPAGTVVEIPAGAVDVADLPDVLRW